MTFNYAFIFVCFIFTGFVSAQPTYKSSPEQISETCQSYINTFNQRLDQLLVTEAAPSYVNVLEPLDDALLEFLNGGMHDGLMRNVHTDKAVREASTTCFLQAMSVFTGLNMNRPLYQKIIQIDESDLTPEQRFTLNYWKNQFESSGIGEDEATRKEIKALTDEINQIEQIFQQNITDDVRSIQVKASRLTGLPQDYIDSHLADEKGLVTITTSYPDVSPIFKYAHDGALRKEVFIMFDSRAYPQNKDVLKTLLVKREQLARFLAHDNFAQLNMLGTMVKTPENAKAFIEQLSAAISKPVEAEKAQLLERKKKLDPTAVAVNDWEASYLKNLIREEDYLVNAKEIRDYFHYDKVRDGITSLAEDLFSLRIESCDCATWHESVEPYEVYENDKLIGRFFLDSHPREGKYTHAAAFPITMGKESRQIPSAALLMNFPKGMMEHGQVKTFLHEFGHLIHLIFAGQNNIALSPFQSESDFGEAPSTMLEEWVWDYTTLKNFATNSEGIVIPKTLVNKMNRARYFGEATSVAYQLTLTAFSLEIYRQDPQKLNLNAFERKIFQQYVPFPLPESSHPYASFGHLTGYGAKYYTYQWSNAISEELLSKFKLEGLRNTQIANEYRHKVLARTGTQPASELVRDFLGRDFGVKAYADRLSQKH